MPGNRAQFDTLSYRLSPAAAHQHNPISNRKRKLLDSRPSYRKHSTSLFLIDNFERSFRKSRIPNSQVFHSTSLLPCFLASLPPGLLASRISNRESKLLETPLSHRKQTTAPRSNREEFHFFEPPILAVDPARPNSRDYPFAIGRLLPHRGKRT